MSYFVRISNWIGISLQKVGISSGKFSDQLYSKGCWKDIEKYGLIFANKSFRWKQIFCQVPIIVTSGNLWNFWNSFMRISEGDEKNANKSFSNQAWSWFWLMRQIWKRFWSWTLLYSLWEGWCNLISRNELICNKTVFSSFIKNIIFALIIFYCLDNWVNLTERNFLVAIDKT